MTGLKKTIFYVLIFVLSLLFTELLLYFVSLVYPVYPIHSIDFVIPDSKLVYRPNPDYPDHDSNGFRNVEVPQKIALVALGDSQTYGSGVEKEDAWPLQLAVLANIKTYSMAFGGYGPVHGLFLLDEAIKHQPNYIVYAFYAGNDLYDSYYLSYNLDELAFLRSTDSLTISNIEKSNKVQPLEEKIEKVYNYKDKNQLVKTLRNIKSFLFENSRVYLLLSAGIRALKDIEAGEEPTEEGSTTVCQKLGDFERRLALEYPEDCLVLESDKVSTIFRPKYRGTALDFEDPRIKEGFNVALRALHEIKKRVEKAGVKFFVLGIPTKESVFEQVVRAENILNIPAGIHFEQLIENEKKMWKLAREFFNEHEIEFIDTLPHQKGLLKEWRQPFDASINEHLNELGHLTVAKCVRDKLTQKIELLNEN